MLSLRICTAPQIVRLMCADFAATRTFGQIDEEGDLIDGPPRDDDDDDEPAAKEGDASPPPAKVEAANGKGGKPAEAAKEHAKEYKSRKSTASQYASS